MLESYLSKSKEVVAEIQRLNVQHEEANQRLDGTYGEYAQLLITLLVNTEARLRMSHLRHTTDGLTGEQFGAIKQEYVVTLNGFSWQWKPETQRWYLYNSTTQKWNKASPYPNNENK